MLIAQELWLNTDCVLPVTVPKNSGQTSITYSRFDSFTQPDRLLLAGYVF